MPWKKFEKKPYEPPTGAAKTYGAVTLIPDRSIIDRIARGFIDALYEKGLRST